MAFLIVLSSLPKMLLRLTGPTACRALRHYQVCLSQALKFHLLEVWRNSTVQASFGFSLLKLKSTVSSKLPKLLYIETASMSVHHACVCVAHLCVCFMSCVRVYGVCLCWHLEECTCVKGSEWMREQESERAREQERERVRERERGWMEVCVDARKCQTERGSKTERMRIKDGLASPKEFSCCRPSVNEA